MRDGFGKTIFANGEEYEGEFVNDLREGIGRMKYTNGDVYYGMWKNGKREGRGKLIPSMMKDADVQFIDNYIQECEWQDDKKISTCTALIPQTPCTIQ